jgi:hypothetical protein
MNVAVDMLAGRAWKRKMVSKWSSSHFRASGKDSHIQTKEK